MGQLRDRMEQDLKLKGVSPATIRNYLLYCRKFAAFFMRSPEELGAAEVRAFLLHQIEVEQLATLEEFTIHLKHHGVQLKESRAELYLYLSENPDMTLDRCTALPFFPERLGDWQGVVVVSQREIKNITVVPDGGSRNLECPYAFSVGSFDVFGDPALVRRIRGTFGQ